MKYIKIFLVFLCIFLSTSQNIFASGTSKHTATGFEKWVAAFREKILSGGYKISAQTFDTAFANVQFNEKVIAADKNQAEFSETFWDYYHKRITRWRVEKGREQYKKYPTLLSKIEKKYGVPGNYIIAFWGMETSYGRYFGGWNVIEALALLTYEGRREEFFERELITALQILEGGHISAEKMRGSWAGAMGNFQFMPTTYAKYAIDGDGDGKINIWENVPDAFHSAANFLKNIGWKDGYRWGREVIVPDDFDWMLIGDEDVKKTTTAWRKLGVKKNDGMPLDQSNVVGYLFAPQGKDGPVFLAYQNFDVIMRWNESYNYAIAVGILSDAIISSQVYTTEINEPLLKKNVIEIQKKLHKMGIYKYDDFRGVVNNRTRSAIREYQKAHGLTPDGYPSKKTSLHILDKCGTK